jgi:hypothetical protein
MLKKLIFKEIKGFMLFPVGLIFILIALWDFFLRLHIGVWQNQDILGLATLQLAIPFIWSIAMAFYTLYSEWNTNTVYLLLSLPIKGITLIGAKLTAIISGLFSIYIFGIICYLINFRALLSNPISQELIWCVGVNSLLFLAVLIVICQFSFLIGRIVPKYCGLFTGIIFLAVLWLMDKIDTLQHLLFKRILPSTSPAFSFGFSIGKVVKVTTTADWNFKFVIGSVLSILLFLCINGWLLERRDVSL